MAVTQLIDVVIPEVYQSYDAVNSPELTAFFESGVAVRNPILDANAVEGGTLVNIPFWKDLDSSAEPNYSTDDPTDVAVADNVTADKMIARVAQINKGYGSADLVTELAGSDPMQRIRNRFGTYWTRQFQKRLLAVVTGVYNDNVDANASDMVNDISQETLVGLDAGNLFSREAFTGAIFTLGDAFGDIAAIAVHSIVYKRMVDNDDIEFIRDSTGTTMIPTFMGKTVIVDDSMPVIAGTTSGYRYVSVLFGSGAMGFGNGNPRVPVELYRRPDQGNGGGVETLWERNTWIIQPFGYKWTETSVTGGQSPNLTDLKNKVNWTRVIERKNVPMAFLITNG